MADISTTNSQVQNESDSHSVHEIKEAAASPKSTQQRRNQEKDGVDESLDGEKKTKPKEFIKSTKPSPNKPPLPPRPAGHTPGKKYTPAKPPAPCTATHSPLHNEHSESPPTKPTSPRPHRPPNPSHQSKISKAKSPEITRSLKMAHHVTETPSNETSIGSVEDEQGKMTVANNVDDVGTCEKKKMDKPPRPVGCPPVVQIIENDETTTIEKKKRPSIDRPPKPNRILNTSNDVIEHSDDHVDVSQDNDIVTKGDTPNEKHDTTGIDKKVTKKQEKPSRPSLPSQRSLSDSSNSSAMSTSKHVHSPPTVAKKPEHRNHKNKTYNKEKQPEDTQTVERRNNRKPLFRVHSFSKTEVESFNSDVFTSKLEKGGVKEAYKPGKPPPPVLPKPTHNRPPPPRLKKAKEKNENNSENMKKEETQANIPGQGMIVESLVDKVTVEEGKTRTVEVPCEHIGGNLENETMKVPEKQVFDVDKYLTEEKSVQKEQGETKESEAAEKSSGKYNPMKYVVDEEQDLDDKVNVENKENEIVKKIETDETSSKLEETVLNDSKIVTKETNLLSKIEVEIIEEKATTGDRESETKDDLKKKTPSIARPPMPNIMLSVKQDVVEQSKELPELVKNNEVEDKTKLAKKTRPPRPNRSPSIKQDVDEHSKEVTVVVKNNETEDKMLRGKTGPPRPPSIKHDVLKDTDHHPDVEGKEHKEEPAEKARPPKPTRVSSIKQEIHQDGSDPVEIAHGTSVPIHGTDMTMEASITVKPKDKPTKPAPPHIIKQSDVKSEMKSEVISSQKPAKPAFPHIPTKSDSHKQPDESKSLHKPVSPHIMRKTDGTDMRSEATDVKPTQKPTKPTQPHIIRKDHSIEIDKQSKPSKPASPLLTSKSDHTDTNKESNLSVDVMSSRKHRSAPPKPASPHIKKKTDLIETDKENVVDVVQKPNKPALPSIIKKSEKSDTDKSEHSFDTVKQSEQTESTPAKPKKKHAPPVPISPQLSRKPDGDEEKSDKLLESGGENVGEVKGEKVETKTKAVVCSEENVKKLVKDIEIDEETNNGQISSEETKKVEESEDNVEVCEHEVNTEFQNLGLLKEMKNVSVEIKLEESNGENGREESPEKNNLEVGLGDDEVLINENDPIVASLVEEGFTEMSFSRDNSSAQDFAEKRAEKNSGDVDIIESQVMSQDIKSQKNEGFQEPIVTLVSNVPSPKKKAPPKPKRTSSLKKDSQPIVKVLVESGEGASETNRDSLASCESHPEIQEEPPVSTKVTFQDEIDERKDNSRSLGRSNSFSSSTKKHNDTACDRKESEEETRVKRRRSFGGVMKKKRSQPARPSPPTFFVQQNTSDNTQEISRNSVSAESDSMKSEPVEVLEAKIPSKHDSLASEVSSKHDSMLSETSSKHDSMAENTTDSDSGGEESKEDVAQHSKTYYISREILTTERSFVDAVKLVSEDFPKAVKQLGNNKFGRSVIPEETLQEIMLNINQIYEFDREFLKSLEDRMESWEENQRIGDIIKKFSPFLKMYKTYIQGYDNAMAVLSDSMKKYPQFAEVVKEFACSERCQNLTVGMYMLKPIQRIPSYRLLLIDYLKHLSKDSLDYKDVSDSLAIVSDVATHINEDMKRVDNFEAVLKVQRSLVGQVEIVKPGRELIKEGLLMKLSRKEMQARMFYLFTDVLLYTTPVANNQYSLNLSLPLGEIKVEIPVSPDFDNEFSIISTKKSFTLSASTAEEREEWLEALRNASDEIRKKKMTYQVAKKEKMDALLDKFQENEDKEGKLGSKAPVWIPDVRVSMCMLCTDNFTVTNRRHHCRACGKVICGSCSSNTAPLSYLNSEAARVCDNCYEELTETSSAPSTGKTGSSEQIENVVEVDSPSSKISPIQKVNENRTIRSKKEQKKFGKKQVPAAEESTISGYLMTRKGKRWHKRWYVVKDNVLYVSKATSDVVALETCPLLGYDVRGPDKMDGDSKKIVFQLIHAGTEPVVLQTDNIKSAERWVNALRRATMLPH